MGFLPPAIAAIGSALSAGAAAVGSGLAAIGGGSAVAGAATAASLAIGAKSILTGAPKASTATTSAPAPAKPIAPAIPNAITPVNTGGLNKSLAALSPGLALGGTAGYLGASNNKGGKTLLGQ